MHNVCQPTEKVLRTAFIKKEILSFQPLKEWKPISLIEPAHDGKGAIYLGAIPNPEIDLIVPSYDVSYTPHSYVTDYQLGLVISALEHNPRWTVNVRHHLITINDEEIAPLSKHFESVADLIDAAVQSGTNMLIHCRMGISRSPSLLTAYYLKFGLPDGNRYPTLEQVFAFLRQKRKCISPNTGFILQLLDFEKSLERVIKQTPEPSTPDSTSN